MFPSFSLADINFDKFSSKLKGIKSVSNRPVFSGGPGMGGRYGGKTLHEMKVEMEDEEASSGSNNSLNEQATSTRQQPAAASAAPFFPASHKMATPLIGLQPGGRSPGVKLPSVSPGAPGGKTKKKPIAPPPTRPRPEKKTQAESSGSGFPVPSVKTSVPHAYTNFPPPTQRQEEAGEDEDEEGEEEYVVPSTLLEQDEEPGQESIYQNYNCRGQNGAANSSQAGAKYVNLMVGSQPHEDDQKLYANISFDGQGKARPLAPPRDMRRPRGHRK